MVTENDGGTNGGHIGGNIKTDAGNQYFYKAKKDPIKEGVKPLKGRLPIPGKNQGEKIKGRKEKNESKNVMCPQQEGYNEIMEVFQNIEVWHYILRRIRLVLTPPKAKF
jgi:hypothetical protein